MMTSQSHSQTVPPAKASTSPGGLAGSSTSPINPAPHAPPVNSDDPAWKHCMIPDMTKKASVECNFCHGVYIGGITRMKYHLANVKYQNVVLCQQVLADVKHEMRELISRKDEAKEKKARDSAIRRGDVTVDGNDARAAGEDGILGGGSQGGLLVLSGKRRSKGNTSGSMDKFCTKSIGEVVAARKGEGFSTKLQTKLSTQRREERRVRACEYVCQFFYEAGIAHNAVLLPSFELMLEAVGAFGTDMKGHTPYEMGGPYLKRSKKKVEEGFAGHKEAWKLT
uniref:BED-type domain-containing protein n=1 Tax=Triticum urartu TaxID=4572 RepID=A0A8R7P2B3_TRIUA